MEALSEYGVVGGNVEIDHCKNCTVRRAQMLAHLYQPDKTLVIVRRVLYRNNSTYIASFLGRVCKVEGNRVTVTLKAPRAWEPLPKVISETFPDCLPMIRLANGVNAVRFDIPDDKVYHPLVAVGTRCNRHCVENCTIHIFEKDAKKVKV
jgi:hypothetical protein